MRRRSPQRRVAAASPTSPTTAVASSASPSPATVDSRASTLAVQNERTPSSPLDISDTSGDRSAQAKQPHQKKKIVRPPKHHETAAFLAREAFPGSPNAVPSGTASTVNGPLGNAHRVGEAYRIIATLLKDANEAARRSRPVSWGYGSTDGALAHNHTKRSVTMAPISFFRRGNVRAVAAGDRLSVFLTCE